VTLVAGTAPVLAASQGIQPIEAALLIAWVCLAFAGAAGAVLLRGALLLSERRGAFVSAVTHELRTPLTTLRLYTDMLAEGMIPSEEKRAQYFETLRTEAERLGHLVENVLAYSRLERRGLETLQQAMALRSLIERVEERLTRHAERASMRLEIIADEDCLKTEVLTDPSAVEQILFNLVDNACKYAATAADRRIHLGVSSKAETISVEVRDHGQIGRAHV